MKLREKRKLVTAVPKPVSKRTGTYTCKIKKGQNLNTKKNVFYQ